MVDPLANALILIPDIGGFSNFVKDTEVSHSQHIIQELLEVIIEANEISLQVSEIEGDAVLFYKDLAEPTSLIDLANQIKTIYFKFHTHLKLYDNQRICQCGACSTANKLQLKFVLHNGPLSFNSIKGHHKLFGENVIKAHRLLKNDITSKEYALFAEGLLDHFDGDQENVIQDILSSSLVKSSSTYDIGEINYVSADLIPLYEEVPEPTIENYGLKGSAKLLDVSVHQIKAPLEQFFNVLSDYSIREKWSKLIKDSVDLNSFVARNGSSHRCLIKDDSSDPFFNAHDFEISKDKIVFHETDQKKGYSIVFEMERVGNETKVVASNYLTAGWLKVLFFKLIVKHFIRAGKNELFTNIETYCQRLTEAGENAQQQIDLGSNRV